VAPELFICVSGFLFNFYLKFGYLNLSNLILNVLPEINERSFLNKKKLRDEIKEEMRRNGIDPFQTKADK
jgi:hypothetical protein